jgi:hypothetical protein
MMSQSESLASALEKGLTSWPFEASRQKVNRDLCRRVRFELGTDRKVHRLHALLEGKAAGCVLEPEAFLCGCLEAEGQVGDRELEQTPDTIRVEEAQVGDQVNREAQAHTVFGDGEQLRVQERFAHQREVDPFAQALFGDFIEKAHGQRYVHLAPPAGHQIIRTEEAIEIAAIGEFEKDALERFCT